jgi:hypothetical protein
MYPLKEGFYPTNRIRLVGWFMVFNATFNNFSAISWWSVLLMEKTGVLGENRTKQNKIGHISMPWGSLRWSV